MRHWKISLTFGVMACLLSSSAFAATVEQDKAMQERALEYNRQYDIAHGYFVPSPEMTEEEFNEAAEPAPIVRLAPVEKRIPNQPIMREEIRTRHEAPPVIRPDKVNSKKPQWLIDYENDKKRQEEALEYNRRYDAERGYTNR